MSYSSEWALFRVGWREGRPCLTAVSGLYFRMGWREGRPCLTAVSGLYLGWAGGRGASVLQW